MIQFLGCLEFFKEVMIELKLPDCKDLDDLALKSLMTSDSVFFISAFEGVFLNSRKRRGRKPDVRAETSVELELINKT